MCSVSAVSEYYVDEWPQRFPNNPQPFVGADEETKQMMRKVLELLDRIDKKLGDVDCLDDSKAKFLEQFRNR